MKQKIVLIFMCLVITAVFVSCSKKEISKVSTQLEETKIDDIVISTEDETPNNVIKVSENTDDTIPLVEQEKKAKQLYDYYFDEYEIISRDYYKDGKVYIMGDGNGFKPTIFYEILAINERKFHVAVIYYNDSEYLYIQSNNGETIDEDIANPKDYMKTDITYTSKNWHRYDLSESYIYSTKNGEDENLDYLASVLP